MKSILGLLSTAVLLCAAHGADRIKRAPFNHMTIMTCRRNPSLAYCRSLQNQPPPQAALPAGVNAQPALARVPDTAQASSAAVANAARQPVDVGAAPAFAAAQPVEVAAQPAAVPQQQRSSDGVDWASVCAKYRSHFHHYCGNIEEHPSDHHDRLLRYCPIYAQKCPKEASEPAMDAQWFPEVGATTQPPCVWNCTMSHCTEECKCLHHKEHFHNICHTDKKVFAFTSNDCMFYYNRCGKYVGELNEEAHVEAVRNVAVRKGLPPPNPDDPHNRNHHAQFFTNPESTHADWMHGGARTGQNWGVPAFGIGGSAGEVGAKFPGPAQFLGIDNPHGPVEGKK